MKIAITSIQRNRNPYIVEWIAFHLSVGFTQFYLYSHKTNDGMTETLLHLSKKYPVKVFQIDMEDSPQIAAYQHAWENFGKSVDWMAFIDGDEFLFPTQQGTMNDALQPFNNLRLSALAVYWKCYGSNGHISDPKGLILEKYPCHSNEDFLPNRHIKSIVKGGEIVNPNRAHLFETKLGTFDEQLRPINNGIMANYVPSYDSFRINHYVTQSHEYYFTIKQNESAADLPSGNMRTTTFFNAHDRNEENDGITEKLLPALQEKYNELIDFLSKELTKQTTNINNGNTHIFQIYYSNETKYNNDPGFHSLDNLANERPDWREYWPIRTYLHQSKLEEDAYYGFFSPKFKQKTGLDSFQVFSFINEQESRPDIILFSPFFDQCAFPINQFEQGVMQHANIYPAFEETIKILSPDQNISSLIMHSRNTVFCNYFVAKPKFWRAWLDQCEQIFAIAEEGKSDFAKLLNSQTNHDDSLAPIKVFVIERIASLMLSTQKHWNVAVYDPTQLPYSKSRIADYKSQLILLDALKIAFQEQHFDVFLSSFFNLRESVLQLINAKNR